VSPELHRWLRTTCVGATLLLTLARSPSATADAVASPPKNCPKGTVPITDQGGPRCAKAPPENCPNGFRGQIGGTCAVATCHAPGHCKETQRCVPAAVCVRPQQRWYEFRSEHRGSWFGAPPRKLDKPVTDWIPAGLCDGQTPCTAPSECRTRDICWSGSGSPPTLETNTNEGPVSSGAPTAEAAAPIGDGAPVTEAAPAEQERPSPAGADGGSAAPATSGHENLEAPPTGGTKPSGCGSGCAVGRKDSIPLGAAVLLGSAGLALLRRRHTRR
jgi:hypothetical protein